MQETISISFLYGYCHVYPVSITLNWVYFRLQYYSNILQMFAYGFYSVFPIRGSTLYHSFFLTYSKFNSIFPVLSRILKFLPHHKVALGIIRWHHVSLGGITYHHLYIHFYQPREYIFSLVKIISNMMGIFSIAKTLLTYRKHFYLLELFVAQR